MLLAYRYTTIHTAALLWWLGRWVVSRWWGCTWVGRTCGIIRGRVFVPMGDGPVMFFFERATPISK